MSALPKTSIDDIRHRFATSQIKRVKVGAFDIDGVLRGKYISPDKFWSAVASGLGFCDVIFGWDINDVLLDKLSVTGWHTGYPDSQAIIDIDTYREIPWEPGTAFFLLDSPLPMAPRTVFRRVLARAEELNYKPYLSAEFEFWFFRETPQSIREKSYRGLTPLSPGNCGYSVLRASENSALVIDILEQLTAFDIGIEGFHTETGPGVYESALAVDTGLRAPDKAALFKTAVKEIAARHGVMPTFMAKWNADLPGSSGHIHQSLWRSDKNLMHDGPTRAHCIAGIVKHLPEFMAIICPTINSYKRTVPGAWAPINATWGEDNRTTAVRSIPGTAKSSRIELRLAGSDINPYLAMAAALASGIEGIENKLECPPATTNAYAAGNAPPLPRTLQDAVQLFRRSDSARRWFGDEFVDHYAVTREWEITEYNKAVTNWELARYFEAI